jgi:hypothetical protein
LLEQQRSTFVSCLQPNQLKTFEREKTHSNALIEAQQATNPTWLGKKAACTMSRISNSTKISSLEVMLCFAKKRRSNVV